MRNFPDWLEAYLEYTKDSGAPDKYLRWGGISAVAACLERRTWINYRNLVLYPNLYVFFVGSSGLARKSTSANYAVELVKQVPGLYTMSDQATPAAVLKTLMDAAETRPQLKVGNDMFMNSSLFIYASEAVTFLKDTGSGSMIELLTALYDCGPAGWNNDVAWEKTTLSRGRWRIFNPCLNMLVCTTADWLNRILAPEDIPGGFFSRALFVVQLGAAPGEPDSWIDHQDSKGDGHNAFRRKLIDDLIQISRLVGRYTPDKDMRELHSTFVKDNHKYMIEHMGHKYMSYFARKPTHVLKVAQSVAASKRDSLIITAQDWEEARLYVEDNEKDMPNIFTTQKEITEDKNYDRVWDFIYTHPQVTRPEMENHFRSSFSRGDLMEYLKRLVDDGKIRYEIVNTKLVYVVIQAPTGQSPSLP